MTTGSPPNSAPLAAQLEPTAVQTFDPNGTGEISAEIANLLMTASIAVSVKRMADTLDQIGLGNPRAAEIIRQFTYNLGREFACGIEQVAFSIGQQMRRGQDVG